MSYTPRPGDYGVVKTNGLVGFLIRVGTMSRWNHAFICVDDNLIVEARPIGATLSPVSKYPRAAYNQHENISDEQREKIIDFAVKAVGTPYGFIDILVIFLRILGLRFGSKTRLMSWLGNKDGLICSELVAKAYETADFKLINEPSYIVTPGDLAERLIYQ